MMNQVHREGGSPTMQRGSLLVPRVCGRTKTLDRLHVSHYRNVADFSGIASFRRSLPP